MERMESYLHTRNYGCRLRRYTWNQVEMLSLENQAVKVVLALGKGADIVEFVHKATDVDCMWHSFNELKNINHIPSVSARGGSFLDAYAGGWQELFPTYGAPADFRGGEIGIHGEACIYPWDCRALTDTPECVEVLLTLRTIRSPFLLEKRVKLLENDPTLYLHQRVTNLGSTEQAFMWGHHPAFGFPFLDESVRIRLPGRPTVTVPQGTIAHRCPFDRETTGPWPGLPGKDGREVAMDRAYAPGDRLYMEYAVSDLAEGRFELVNRNRGLGVRFTWDKAVFRYLWVWGLYCGIDEYPWYGRSYVLAVEPWSSMPGDYEAAKADGSLLRLPAGASMETELNAEIFQTSDEALL
ncbi:MAG: aldose 1-epimerase [Oscillospiraceae bacterium]|nr:aldose 1-epimerase [Oscillospiraceae bacterium]